MNIKLTLGERLKDLRVERHLKLETLAELMKRQTERRFAPTVQTAPTEPKNEDNRPFCI